MSDSLKVKICGIRRYEDAREALDAGAWALGFIFHRPSRRYIEPAEAASIVKRLPSDTLSVGVFVDYELDDLNDVVATVRLRGAQLHGDEGPDYAKGVEAGLVIKAFRVGPEFSPEIVREFAGAKILLDTYHQQLAGGTGETFDWSVARQVGKHMPFLLAGGLTPENVTDAIATASPEGIDVSGGVEQSPGVKDPEKIRALFRAIE